MLWGIGALAQVNQSQKTEDTYLKRAHEIQYYQPGMAHVLYAQAFESQMLNLDTAKAVATLIEWSKLYAHHANFNESYDKYWQALKLADDSNDQEAIANVYNGLGWLYTLFKRYNHAAHYFNASIGILKRINNPESNYTREYWALAIMFRKKNVIDTARLYLDSCIQNSDRISSFVKSEIAFNDYHEGKYEEALAVLLQLEGHFKEMTPWYLVQLHYYLGKIYEAKKDYQNAKSQYQQALDRGLLHRSHQDLIPDIYVSQAQLFAKTFQMDKAYESMTRAKLMSDSLFSSRSNLNKALLEIKDDFRQQKDEQAKAIQRKRIESLEQEEKLWKMRIMLTYMGVLMVAITGLFYYRHLRGQHKTEKKIMLEKQRIELEKANEILELKNRELTASALQILKRDETINQVKRQIHEQKNNPDQKNLNAIVNRINLSQADDWQEFETRFVSLNKGFYDALKSKFPTLTPSDLKLCALLKLGFNSKELAGLLGLSVESTHTTRYRLRKKLGLSRQDNLEQYIADMK